MPLVTLRPPRGPHGQTPDRLQHAFEDRRQDGTGAGAQVLIATFEQNALVTAADIEIF